MKYLVIALFLCEITIAFPLDMMDITDTPRESVAGRMDQLDVLDYEIRFTIKDTFYTSTTVITFINKVDTDSAYFFDFGDFFTFGWSFSCGYYDDSAGEWESVPPHFDDSLFFPDIGPFPVGDTVKVYLDGLHHRYGIGVYKDIITDGPYYYSLFWPSLAREVFPCIDHPSDRATCTLIMRVPEGLTIAAGGVLIDSVASALDSGYVDWIFRYDNPVCTYNISFAVGNYETIDTCALDSLPIRSYAYPSRSIDTRYDFERIPEIITLWDSLFGDYPFPRAGCVVTPLSVWGGGGGMEHQMLPNIGQYLITGSRTYEEVVAHELLHQWFGDCIGIADWRDFWLNEGIAVYSEVLWTEYKLGPSAARNYIASEESGYRSWVATNPDFPMYDPESYLSPIPYNKGACWWHMLRWMVGDSLFFDFLPYYFDRFANKTVVTDSLLQAIEDFTHSDWDWYFDQWVYNEGYPRYLYDHHVRHDSTGWWLDVYLRQRQTSPGCTLFTNPVPLEITTPDSVWEVTIYPTSRNHYQCFPLDDTISFAWYDRYNILCGTFTYEPTGILETPPTTPKAIAIKAYPNPFNSTVNIGFRGVGASKARPGQVGEIKIYDISGKLIADLPVPSTGCDGGGGAVEGPTPLIWTPDETIVSGVYLVRATNGDQTATKRVVYLK